MNMYNVSDYYTSAPASPQLPYNDNRASGVGIVGPTFFNNQQPTHLDLMTEKPALHSEIEDNQIPLPSNIPNSTLQCDPRVFRCTLSAFPGTNELLDKSKLPLGLMIQPFRDLEDLRIINGPILRCRFCRAYLNPYINLIDNRNWKCNLCCNTNELPHEFAWNHSTRTFENPFEIRPELQSATIEYIASSDYLIRPVQPTVYLFMLDVSSNAIECGYLHSFVEQLLKDIDAMPGDERSLIGFIAVDANVHFFQFLETSFPPKHLIAYDVDESYVPADNGLIVKISDFKDAIISFVQSLPTLFEFNSTSSNCLGAALNFGRDLIAYTGGRITVMLASIPNVGPGVVNIAQESARTTVQDTIRNNIESLMSGTNKHKEVKTQNLSPTTDFYKMLALECDAKAICVDLFALGEKHQDIASLSDISKFTGGSVYHFPQYHLIRNQTEVKRFQRILSRYLTRKLGLEAVLRVRCSRGISICAFYGNFFVRSTDLISLANVNPDSTVGIELRIDQALTNQEGVLFQAALLYSTTTGERRIRLHTLCLPVVNEVSRIFNSVDIKATTSLVAKMAVDKVSSGTDLSECRDIILNVLIDVFKAYNNSMGHHPTSLLVPIRGHLKYFPLFMQGLLKHRAFSNAVKPKMSVDERVSSMMLFFYASIEITMLEVYPALYAVHNINQTNGGPLRLALSYAKINKDGIYLLDTGSYLYLYVCSSVRSDILKAIFDVDMFSKIDEEETLKPLDNPMSILLHEFLADLFYARGRSFAPLLIIRDDSLHKDLFTRRLVEDQTDALDSFVELLQYLKRKVSSN